MALTKIKMQPVLSSVHKSTTVGLRGQTALTLNAKDYIDTFKTGTLSIEDDNTLTICKRTLTLAVARPRATPLAAMVDPADPGSVTDGDHRYLVRFTTAEGDSRFSPKSLTVTVADKGVNGKILVSGIPLGGPDVTGRKLYRTAVSTGANVFKLLTTISDNTTTTYTDNIADASLTTTAVDVDTTATANIARTFDLMDYDTTGNGNMFNFETWQIYGVFLSAPKTNTAPVYVDTTMSNGYPLFGTISTNRVAEVVAGKYVGLYRGSAAVDAVGATKRFFSIKSADPAAKLDVMLVGTIPAI